MQAVLSHDSVPAIGHVNGARGRPFAEVLGEATERAALNYDDTVLPLAALRLTEDATLDVPGIGPLELTQWSRTQLSRMLGIRWERWFNDGLVNPSERADEVNRRLQRHTATWKIRSRRHLSTESGEAAGVLRGFVGAQYAPIDDVRILSRLAEVLGDEVASFRFARVERTDRSSYYVALSIADMDLGVDDAPDLHRPGLLVRNSEVGACAVSLFEYLFRVVCTNGLVVQVGGKALFYRVHRKMVDERLNEGLYAATFALADRWNRTAIALRAARRDRIVDPEERLRSLVSSAPETRRYLPAVLDAYSAEHMPTRFGLIQAMTRAAQGLQPEDRFQLESRAGELIHV